MPSTFRKISLAMFDYSFAGSVNNVLHQLVGIFGNPAAVRRENGAHLLDGALGVRGLPYDVADTRGCPLRRRAGAGIAVTVQLDAQSREGACRHGNRLRTDDAALAVPIGKERVFNRCRQRLPCGPGLQCAERLEERVELHEVVALSAPFDKAAVGAEGLAVGNLAAIAGEAYLLPPLPLRYRSNLMNKGAGLDILPHAFVVVLPA